MKLKFETIVHHIHPSKDAVLEEEEELKKKDPPKNLDNQKKPSDVKPKQAKKDQPPTPARKDQPPTPVRKDQPLTPVRKDQPLTPLRKDQPPPKKETLKKTKTTEMNDSGNASDGSVMDVLDEGTKQVHKRFSMKYKDGTVIAYHAPQFVNFISTTVYQSLIKGSDYEPTVKAKPRGEETFFRISKSNNWHRGISVFRDYLADSDELDKRCFEFDWLTSKLPKLLEKGKDIADCK